VFLTAEKIHDGISWLPEGTVIETNEEGSIVALHDATGNIDANHYDGILAPGFVNVHCHLELSHMKGAVQEHTGLIPFLQQVMAKRFGFTDEQKKEARETAFQFMLDNGIVALGDIANTNDTLEQQATGKMHFYSFAEAIGFNELPLPQFETSKKVYEGFAAQQPNNNILKQSIVPHAPYSVSHALFKLIDAHLPSTVISIHNQESKAEDEYYISKTGQVHDLLQGFGIDDTFFHPSGKPSILTYAKWMSPGHNYIFVHNTYTSSNDVIMVQRLLPDVYWCLCPNANLYIENALPDVNMLVRDANNICIGTDSLSSNHQLSVLAELATLKKHYPNLDWATLLRWGTYNGARALQMQDTIGKIEEGKKPGIVQITSLYNDPVVKRII